MALVDLLPQPSPVTLAGTVYLVQERSLLTMAYFESFALSMRGAGPPPYAEPDLERAEYRRRLRQAFDAVESTGDGLPSWGTPEVVAALMGTPQGRTEYLRRTVLACQAGQIDPAELDSRMSEADWLALLEATGPRDELAKLDRLILAEIGAGDIPAAETGEGTPLREVIATLSLEMGLPPSAFGDWTVSQLLAVVAKGKKRELTRDRPEAMTREQFAERVLIPLERFWAEDSQANEPASAGCAPESPTPTDSPTGPS